MVEQDSSIGVVFPPHSFIVLNGINPEEPTINVISADGSEPVTNASQFPDWNQTLNGCFGPIMGSAIINCTQEVLFSITLPGMMFEFKCLVDLQTSRIRIYL